MLYVTDRAYDLYIENRGADYDIWMRSVYLAPRIDDWTFWQYTDKAVLNGYHGEKKYIDLNVFHGTQEEFKAYP